MHQGCVQNGLPPGRDRCGLQGLVIVVRAVRSEVALQGVPQVAVLGLSHRGGPRAALGPDIGERALLTEPRFILEEDLELLVGMRGSDDGELLGQATFLKSACRAGSALTCRGRGANDE